MAREEIASVLQEIFRDIFDDDTIVLTETMTADDIEDWDSLMNINIVNAIEDKYDIEFLIEDIVKLRNVGDFITLIETTLLSKQE